MTFGDIVTEALKLSLEDQRRLAAVLERAIRDASTSEVRPLSDDKDTLEVEQFTEDSGDDTV